MKMESKEYQFKTAEVDRKSMDDVIGRIDDQAIRLLHHAMGIGGEAGELVDAIKKHIFYGKPLDEKNVVEEIGDILWYATRLLNVLGYSLEDAMGANHIKLNKKRYAKGYSDKAAVDRADKKEEEDPACSGSKQSHRKLKSEEICRILDDAFSQVIGVKEEVKESSVSDLKGFRVIDSGTGINDLHKAFAAIIDSKKSKELPKEKEITLEDAIREIFS